jgi:hypothetical protein
MMDHQARAPGMRRVSFADLAYYLEPGVEIEAIAAMSRRNEDAGDAGGKQCVDRFPGTVRASSAAAARSRKSAVSERTRARTSLCESAAPPFASLAIALPQTFTRRILMSRLIPYRQTRRQTIFCVSIYEQVLVVELTYPC